MSVIAPNPVPVLPAPLRWSRERLYAAVDAGVFGEDEKLGLICGIVTYEGMEDRRDQKSVHALAIRQAAALLSSAFGGDFDVRYQMPMSLGTNNEPEPDVSVVLGCPQDYRDHHPTTAELVVQVAESTLRFDRTTKASLYASAQIPEYWIVNLVDGVLEVHKQPVPDRDEPFGWRYGSAVRLEPGDTVAPVRAPGSPIPVSEMLP